MLSELAFLNNDGLPIWECFDLNLLDPAVVKGCATTAPCGP